MVNGLLVAATLAFTVPSSVTKNVFVVETEDRVAIQAVEYRANPAAHRRTVIIVGDGFSGTESSDIDALAEALFNRGLDIVTFDRRGTGYSTGTWDFGASDAVDLTAVVRAVHDRTFQHEVGILGVGSGGVAAVEVAGRTAKVRALALYGVGSNGAPPSGGWWTKFTTPESVTGRLYLRLQGVRPGAQPDVMARDLISQIAKLRRRPVFISVGGRGERVTKADALALYEAAQPPKEWGYAPGAGDTPPVESMASSLSDFFTRRLR